MSEISTVELEDIDSEYVRLQKDLVDIFTFYIPDDLKEKAKDEQVRVISVGCGQAQEIKGLRKVFKNSYIKAIDIDEMALKAARVWNTPDKSIQIEKADATDPSSYGLEPWDMVLIRNPRPANLEKIFTTAVGRLKQGGILFITNPSDVEQRDVLNDIPPYQGAELKEVYRGPIIDVLVQNKFPNHEESVAVYRKK